MKASEWRELRKVGDMTPVLCYTILIEYVAEEKRLTEYTGRVG